MEILSDIGDARTGSVPAEEHTADPNRAAKYVVNEVSGISHLRRTSDRWTEGTDDRNKAGEDYGAATVFLIKFVGALKMAAAKKERILATVQSGSSGTADPVAKLVPGDGAEDPGY